MEEDWSGRSMEALKRVGGEASERAATAASLSPSPSSSEPSLASPLQR